MWFIDTQILRDNFFQKMFQVKNIRVFGSCTKAELQYCIEMVHYPHLFNR